MRFNKRELVVTYILDTILPGNLAVYFFNDNIYMPHTQAFTTLQVYYMLLTESVE